MLRPRSPLFVVFLVTALCASIAVTPSPAKAQDFSTKIFTAAAVGAAVNAAGPELNKFVNTLTFNGKVPYGTGTRVVPILSVGEKGYVGAAQVSGPASEVAQVKAVWAYDDSFSNNEFRLRILVPSASLNPLQLSKVQKVGVTAVIDVSLSGAYKGETLSRAIDTGDVIRAGGIAVAVAAAANPLNRAVNMVTGGLDANTRVTPIVSVGEKAYIGGAQVSGPSRLVAGVKGVLQYEAAFSTGRYRVKAFIPIGSINPIKNARVSGVGITAIIDTSVADQEVVRARQVYWRSVRYPGRPMYVHLENRFRDDIRHDNGLHKGWYIGKGNQAKVAPPPPPQPRRDDRRGREKDKHEHSDKGKHRGRD